MAITNQPSISLGSSQVRDSFGQSAIVGRSKSASAGASASRPVLLQPNPDLVQQDFGTLQDSVGTNRLQDQAINTQESLGETLKNLLSDSENQSRSRLSDGFQRAAQTAVQDVGQRGNVSQEQLQADAQRATDRAQGLELGDLVDRLLGQKEKNAKTVQGNITDLLFGSSNQATDLINALLGSSAIGNLSQSQSRSESVSTNGSF